MSVDRAEKRRWDRSGNATGSAGSDATSEPREPEKPDISDDAGKGQDTEPAGKGSDERVAKLSTGKPTTDTSERSAAPSPKGDENKSGPGDLRAVPTVHAGEADGREASDLNQLLSDESDPAVDELDALLEAFDDEPGEDGEILRQLIGDQEAEPSESTAGDLESDQESDAEASGVDEDPTMSELDRLLSDDLDDDPAEIGAIEALLAREVEEVSLDADPVMNELEGLLATEEDGLQDAEELDTLLTEVTEEVDPVTAELDDALALEDDEDGEQSGADVVGEFLAEEAEEARLDADPVMSELDQLLATDDDDAALADGAALDGVLNEMAEEMTVDAVVVEAGQDEASTPASDPVQPRGSGSGTSDGWDDFDADDIFGGEPAEDFDSFDAFADLITDGQADADARGGGGEPAGEDEAADAHGPDVSGDAHEDDGDPIMSELEMILSADLDEEPGYQHSTMLLSEVEANNFEPLKGKDFGGEFARRSTGVAEPDAEPGRKGEGQQHLDKVIARTGVVPRRRTRLWAWLIWLTILGGLIYAAFLPYSFDVGGDFIIQPIEQSQVRARTDGEIISLNVEEGDWVKAGDIMAILSNWDEKKEVAVRKAELEGLQANLNTLKAGAKPEEIAVAKEKVTAAEVQVTIAEKDLERQRQLLEHKTISQALYEDAENELKVAQIALEQAKATLVFVSAAARDSEVEAAEAAVRRSEQELAFSELMFEQTYIRAVSDGQIANSLDEVPVGAFLVEGALFCLLEDNRVVKAEIEVPETDISEVKIGALVELKLWSEAEASLTGEVERIAPVAQERDFGRVVRVVVRVENPDGLLTSNTTGYAKISAREAPVWEVFTRMFVRFFRIELWSWIP